MRTQEDKQSYDILVASYSAIREGVRTSSAGPVVPMLRYFSNNAGNVFLLEQNLPECDFLDPRIEWYKNGKLEGTFLFPRWLRWLFAIPTAKQDSNRTYLRLKLRDILSVIWAVVLFRKHVGHPEVMLGVECINALSLWFCRRIWGMKSKVVYYLFDYCEKRYPNRWVNNLYLWLDKMAAYKSDATWNISKVIELSRIKRGLDEDRMREQVTVNYGMFSDQLQFTDYDDCRKTVMVYAGGVDWWSGLDLIIDAMPKLVENCPEIVLKIMGRGAREKHYRQKVSDLGVEKHVVFGGYIAQPDEVFRQLSECSFALAVYSELGSPTEGLESTKKYGDVIKIRTYLACGLPIIVTDVPFSAREVREAGAGIMIDYNLEELVSAAEKLYKDPDFNSSCRSAARRLAERNMWERNYDKGMRAVLQ